MKRKILIDFGDRVREERTKKGFTQEELATRAKLHRTYVGMVERAEKNITLVSISKIASALNLSVAELLRGVNSDD